jgi:tetratricopeptide (TPR) repeat protein
MPAPKPDKSLLTTTEKERLADKNIDPNIRKRNDMIIRNKILYWLNNAEDVRFALRHIHVRKLKKELNDIYINTLLDIVRDLLDLCDYSKIYDIGKEVIVVKPFETHHNPNYLPNPKPRTANNEDFQRIFSLETALEEINNLIPEYNESLAYEKFKAKKMDEISNMYAIANENGLGLSEADMWNTKGCQFLFGTSPLFESATDIEQSLQYFDRAIKADPTHQEAWKNKLRALEELHRFEEALQCNDKIISLNPTKTDSWLSKGLTLRGLNRYEESLQCFDKILEIDPSNTAAYAMKIDLLKDLGRYSED